MQRVMSTLTDPASRLPQMFWEAGPQRVHDGFAEFLRARIAAGQLDIPDVDRAASQFFCLLKGELHARMVCGCPGDFSERGVAEHIKATVDLFLRAYAPAGMPDVTKPEVAKPDVKHDAITPVRKSR